MGEKSESQIQYEEDSDFERNSGSLFIETYFAATTVLNICHRLLQLILLTTLCNRLCCCCCGVVAISNFSVKETWPAVG